MRWYYFLLPLLTLWACASPKVVDEFNVRAHETAQPGELAELSRTGIADTTVGFVTGFLNDFSTDEPLYCAMFMLTDTVSGTRYYRLSDEQGKVKLIVPAGEYRLEVRLINYTEFDMPVQVGTGDIMEIRIRMGHGQTFRKVEEKVRKGKQNDQNTSNR